MMSAMNRNLKQFDRILVLLAALALAQAAARAEDAAASNGGLSVLPDSRYGWFNALDHRSWYNEGNFPEPFLVDDSGLELNEARLEWLHTKAGAQHSDRLKAEVEKGFGLLTLELEVPYQRDVSPAGKFLVQGLF